MMHQHYIAGFMAAMVLSCLSGAAHAQTVGLPAPRLLTTMPMGGQAGTSFPVTISGQSLDENIELTFSDNRITAVPDKDANGHVKLNSFLVTIAPETPAGVYEARAMTRLGLSSSRAFSVGTLPEVIRKTANTLLETAMKLDVGTICNAYTSAKGVDYYTFTCDQKTHIVVECAARGIDSKLRPVLTIADANGRDLAVDRRQGLLDFTLPQAGQYCIKVHGLTYEGGPEAFYRLALQSIPASATAQMQPSTQKVNAISLPPAVSLAARATENEPNNRGEEAQKITLPCDVAGAFFPAADVDTYEFEAKKGDVWWVEVVSERFGLGTDPFVLVQQVVKTDSAENLVDVAEFNDIPSAVKISTGAYSYNGSPYDVGTADVSGKIEIKADGVYRLQIRDSFGGTRRDPRCIYRLIVRKATPDFALATWALHMELRNGDRSALSKPMTLRKGGTMIYEVVAVRKDGFDGPIQISMADLPPGVRATGLTIPSGKSTGTLLITADENAETAFSVARILGTAEVDGALLVREGRLASMCWPVRDGWQETPNPRLMGETTVSVTGNEAAPLTIAPASHDVIVAQPDSQLTIPLKLTWRGEFSGALKIRPVGAGFEKVKPVEIPLNSPTIDVVVNLAELKLPPGEHTFSLYGGLVTKYRYNVAAVEAATEELRVVTEEIQRLTAASKAAATALESATDENKPAAETAMKEAADQLKQAEAGKPVIENRLKAATAAAAPADLVDIVVCEPIRIQINEAKSP